MSRLRATFLGLILAVGVLVWATQWPLFADQTGLTIPEQDQLQQQLLNIESQIQQYQQQLSQITSQKNTLANKIKLLQKQQAVLQLQIQATNLQVNQLGSQITVTQNSISDNQTHIDALKKQIASIVRSINQNDSLPLIYTIVAQKKLSDVFDAYKNYTQVSQSLGQVIGQLNDSNNQLNQQQQQLTTQQQDAENLLSIKVLQQVQLTSSVSDQNTLLQQTKGKETDYQIVVNDTKAQAAAIANRLYQLLGVSSQITFGDALKIAQWAHGATGIDPAFLLAVLTQESNLGKNVGTCNWPGDPSEKSYKNVMNPTRDIPPFLDITSSLGMNSDITPVSCAMKDKNGKQLGWGGAMGPAQFIPSTWMGYKDKVSQLTGHSPANPWDIRDAFAAAAIKLTSNGADGSEQGDWNAAMRYFSGSTSTKYRFYGDSVIAQATKYKVDIADLSK